MKYQFTVEGSESQTKYYGVKLIGPFPDEELLFETLVSTPLTILELEDFITKRLFGIMEGWHCVVRHAEKPINHKVIGLDSLARILSNVKPLTVKVKLAIDGESKTYNIDADKLDTLLKSLE